MSRFLHLLDSANPRQSFLRNMARPPPRRSEKELAFHKWRHLPDVLLQGVGGPRNNQSCAFIPISALQDYLDKTKLEGLLDAVVEGSVRHEVDADHVLQHYLRPFAILLCLDKGYLIHHFYMHRGLRDASLPFGVRPDDFPHGSDSLFDEFKRAQWQFCATEMHRNMNDHLKKEEILPFLLIEELGHGGSATVYKIVVESSYNNLLPKDSQTASKHPKTFVLKTFRDHEAEANHKAELDAYRKLSDSSPYIVNCYGSFVREESNSYNLILEYADRGTLEDFMRATPKPQTIEDSILFWDRLSDIMRGLAAIHNASCEQNPSRQTLVGWHQDIKPANILVFSGSGRSPYDCYFKIADLGLSHFKAESSQQASTSDFDAYGTRAYGAPETFRPNEAFETCPLIVKQDVDIWSAGCVFSEAATWASFGHAKVLEYRRRRKQEVRDGGGAHGEHVFHHEGAPLKVVEEFHQNIISRRQSLDAVTRPVVATLVGMMLQETGCRPNAMAIHSSSKRIIAEAERKLDISVTGRQDNHHIGPSNSRRRGHRPVTPPQVPPGHHKFSPGSSRKHNLTPTKTPTWTSDSSVTDNDSDFSMRRRPLDSNRVVLLPQERQAFAESRNHHNFRSAGDALGRDPSDHPPSPVARASTSYAEAGTQHFQDLKVPHHNRTLKERPVRPIADTDQFEHNEHRSSEHTTSQHAPNESFDGVAHDSGGGMPGSSTSNNTSSTQSPYMAQQPVNQKEKGREEESPRCILPLAQGLRWKADLKDHKNKKRAGPAPGLPGSHQLAVLNGRDHVFIIDNSESMKTHVPTIKQVIELHGYILKDLDPTGLDIHYTQSTQKKNFKKSTQLVNNVDPETFVGPNTDMKGRLFQIFAEHSAKFGAMVIPEVSGFSRLMRKPALEPQKPISFYILTDGKWQPNNDVASVILGLVRDMEANNLAKEHVAIQFIRFGNDVDGIARMDHLDHDLGLKEKGMDIVDTTFCKGNIWKQLLGAVNDWYDEDPD